MREKTYETSRGTIHYWVNDYVEGRKTLVFLPGLTADHTMFEKQIEYFESKYNILVWDAPGHAASRPIQMDFVLDDKAKWLHGILEQEKITKPYFIGQSMGGYVSQMFMELYPGSLSGFVSIDSASLKRQYISAASLWMLRHITPVYRAYPWKALLRDGSWGVATTKAGRDNMRDMMLQYDHKEYAVLAGHGFGMLEKAIRSNRPFQIDCPCVLICGTKDMAGVTKWSNKKWNQMDHLELKWVKGAGHNSNVDAPDEINQIVEQLINS